MSSAGRYAEDCIANDLFCISCRNSRISASFFDLYRKNKAPEAIIASAPTPIPTPMPALAPVVRPPSGVLGC